MTTVPRMMNWTTRMSEKMGSLDGGWVAMKMKFESSKKSAACDRKTWRPGMRSGGVNAHYRFLTLGFKALPKKGWRSGVKWDKDGLKGAFH